MNLLQMVEKVATRENIQHGLIANSLDDEKYKFYLTFNTILAKCRRSSKTEDYNCCIYLFPYLFERYF